MPPFRAEHIGSLLRPKGLVEGAEDEAIAEAIRWQERLGLKVVTDGEFRRESWRLGFVNKVRGFARADAIGEVAQPLLCDENLRSAVRARGDDPDELIDLYIDLINRIVRARPAGMTIGVHMCRGNAMGRWIASGSYEAIAERTFNTLAVDAYFLEYESERAGGFEPLRFMPKG